MIMGCNIGTTITNTLVSLGSACRSADFEWAFAAATVHGFFNLIVVLVLFPLEPLTGYLRLVAQAITDALVPADIRAAKSNSPIHIAVKAPISLYKSVVFNGVPGGIVVLLTGLAFVLLSLAYITKHMRVLMKGRVERAMNGFVAKGGGLSGVCLGLFMTVAVQSSSITTSLIVPLAASDALSLQNAYYICVGANIGTTITGLLASLAVLKAEGLTIALVHVLFNFTGFVLLFLFPANKVRFFPVVLAQGLARIAATRLWVAILYVVVMFVALPVVGVFAFA